MLWDPSLVDVDIIGSSFQEIHSHVKVSGLSFLLTSLYASPFFDRRKLLWDSLSSLGPSIILPWLILGDFNDISSASKKFGGLPPNRYKISCFNNFLHACNLVDLGFEGPRFTWTNCRDHNNIIRTRIDRGHASPSWLQLFPNTKIFHLPRVRSDHCPLF